MLFRSLEMLAALWLASSVGTTNLIYLSTFVGYACFCLYKLVRQLRKYYAQHEIIWPPLGYRQLVVKCAYGVGLIGGLCAMHWGVRESSWLIGLLGLGATLYFGLTIYLAPKDD